MKKMNVYKVYYKGTYKKHFHDRDLASMWIRQEVFSGGLDFEDFEILDRSDEL